jgi:hypothetical protein
MELSMMEKLYAVQWLSHESNWEVCQTFDSQGEEIAAIYFTEDRASEELRDWQIGTGEDDRYRVAEIEIKGV